MTKPNKISSEFTKKLKETPRQPKFDLHYWADYVELKCLFNVDGVFSKDDFLDAYKSNKDFLPKSTEDATEENNEDDEEILELSDKAYKNDKDEQFADRCFKLIESRRKIFTRHYPFTISSNKRALFKKNSFTWKHRCYVFLLLSSSLKYIRDYKSIFTSSFELFSLKVLKQILPATAEAHFFGSSNSLFSNRRYNGHTWDKLNKLKDDLNEPFIKVKKEDFPTTSTGDAGFDFIGWISNGDKQNHLITFTGQAACTEEWDDKQYSSSPQALSSFIPVAVYPINIVFVPFSIRKADGHWLRSYRIVQCVFLDRQRLLYHFADNKTFYERLPCNKAINELLKFKDSAYN